MTRIISFLCLTALTVTAGAAQTTGSSTLVGTVTDSTGAIVPGAKVVVVHTGTDGDGEDLVGDAVPLECRVALFSCQLISQRQSTAYDKDDDD